MKVLALVLLVGCGGDKPATQTPSNQPPPPADADTRAAEAQREVDQAVDEVSRARAVVEEDARKMRELEQRVDDAVGQIGTAQSEADRAAAAATLSELARQRAELLQRIEEAKAAAERAQHPEGNWDGTECQNNPLAKGC